MYGYIIYVCMHIMYVYMFILSVWGGGIHTYIVFTKYCGKSLTFKVFNFLFLESINGVSLLPAIHWASHDLTHPPPA